MNLNLRPKEECTFDEISLGEIMLRLDPGEGRIKTARSFRAWEGGGEYNVARGLRRCFGLRTSVVTAFAENEVGYLMEDLILQGGVDTSLIKWVPYDGIGRNVRNGINFTERGFGIRGAVGASDRGNTAASQIKPGDIDWDYIFGTLGVRWLHTGGIYAALSEDSANTVIEAVKKAREKGYQLLGVGEMGIGNTTTSSAVASVLLGQPVETMTGRGAGLSSDGLTRKIQAIKKAIDLNKPDAKDSIDVLAKVGGLDIAGMAGVYLGGAALQIPVLIDGFISGVAALVAARLCPEAADYMIASHVSKEPAAHLVLDELGKEAVLHADMCLGEGTGAIALCPFLDMGATLYNTLSTFDDIHVDQYEELN